MWVRAMTKVVDKLYRVVRLKWKQDVDVFKSKEVLELNFKRYKKGYKEYKWMKQEKYVGWDG